MSCVARAKIVASRSVDLEGDYVWTVNGGSGANLGGGLLFKASMRYRVIEDQENGPWRVTTTGYMYSIDDGRGRERIAAHWHPHSPGPHREPHLHFPQDAITAAGAYLARYPIPTGRFTLEDMVRVAINNLQTQPLRTDWQQYLDATESPHLEHRTWHQDPKEKR